MHSVRLAQRAADKMPWVLTHGKHRPPALFPTLGGQAVGRTAESGKAFVVRMFRRLTSTAKDLSLAGLKNELGCSKRDAP